MRPVRRRISSRGKYFSACDPWPCSPPQSRHRCFANSPNRWSCRVRCSSPGPGRMTEPSRHCWFLAAAVMEALLDCPRCPDYSGQRHFPDRPARCRRRLVPPPRPTRHWASRRHFPCCRQRRRRRYRPCLARTIRQARSKWRSRSRQSHVLVSLQPPFRWLTAAHRALFRNKFDWAGWTKHPRYAEAEYAQRKLIAFDDDIFGKVSHTTKEAESFRQIVRQPCPSGRSGPRPYSRTDGIRGRGRRPGVGAPQSCAGPGPDCRRYRQSPRSAACAR